MRLRLLSILCAFALFGCSSDGNEPDGEETVGFAKGNPTEAFECSGIELETLSGKPFDRIHFDAGEVDPETVEARLYLVSGSDRWFPGLVTYAEDPEDPRLAVKLPPHPMGIQGGDIRVQIVGEGFSCAAASVRIESVNAAPGEAARVVAAIQDLVDAHAYTLGLERQDLVKALDPDATVSIPEIGLPLVVTQFGLDHPENPNGLVNIVADGGKVFIEDGQSQDLEFEEAMLAQMGLETRLRDRAAEIRNETPFVLTNGLFHPAALSIDPSQIEINSAKELSDRMIRSDKACRLANGAFSEAVTVVGTIAVGPNPVYKAGMGILALIGTLTVEAEKMTCELHPSRQESLSIAPTQIDLLEDEPSDQRLEKAELTVKSNKWDAVAAAGRIALQIQSSLSSVPDARDAVKAVRAGNVTDTAFSTATKAGKDILMKDIQNGIPMYFGPKQLSSLLEAIESFGDVGPYTWTVDIADTYYLEMVSTNGVFRERTCDNGYCYAVTTVGQDSMNFYPRLESFPSKSPLVDAQASGEVGEIGIAIAPDVKVVRPGATVDLVYEIEGAYNPAMEWSSSSVTKLGPFSVPGDNTVTYEETGRVRFETPADEREYPIVVTAESASKTGLLDPASPYTRSAPSQIAILVTEFELSITPPGACVKRGEDQQYEAIYDEEAYPDLEIEWTAESGPMDRTSGMWTAPMRSGRYIITATATAPATDDFPALTKVAQVEAVVGNCNCWFAFQSYGNGFARSRTREFSMVTSKIPQPDDPQTSHLFHAMFVDGPQLTATPHMGVTLPLDIVEDENFETVSQDTVDALVGSWLIDDQFGVNFWAPTAESEGRLVPFLAESFGSYITLKDPEPLGNSFSIQGKGFAVFKEEASPYDRYFFANFEFGTVLGTSACVSELGYAGWAATHID